MRDRKKSFRHHSLQDEKSLQDILKAVSSGIARGKITFSDEDEKIVMRPGGSAGTQGYCAAGRKSQPFQYPD